VERIEMLMIIVEDNMELVNSNSYNTMLKMYSNSNKYMALMVMMDNNDMMVSMNS
jgi:hypothetical protein